MNTKMKWIIGISSFFVTIIVILFILPFLIDFNKFKPQIQNAVAEKMNARINFSSAKLTIFTGLGIVIKDVTIENTDEVFMGTELFKVKEIKFKTELMQLFKGKFVGTIDIKNPEVNILRGSGKTNLTTLAKKESFKKTNEEHSPQEESLPSQVGNSKSSSSFTDKILIKSFEIRNATFNLFNVNGPKERLVAKVENTNLIISNIGSGKDTKIDFSTEVDYSENDVTAKGLISLALNVNTELNGTEWKNSLFNGKLSFDKLDINFRNAFVKKKSVPFNLAFAGIANPRLLTIDDFKLNLQSIDTKAKVALSLLDKSNANINFLVNSNNLAELGEILPQHKDMLLNATLNLKGKIEGYLTAPETLDTNISLQSKLGDSDINLLFDSKSFKPLKGSLKIQSKNLFLSKIISPFMAKNNSKDEEKNQSKAENKEENESPSSSANSESKKQDLNKDEFSLSDKQKKLLSGSDFSTEISIGKLVYENFNFTNFILNSKIKNYTATLNKFSMNLFSGNLTSNMNVDLAVYPIMYNGNLNLNNVKVEEIYKTIKADAKSSPIEGSADIKMTFNAKGYSRASLSKYLNANGSFLFNDGTLNTKSLISLAGEQFNQFIKSGPFSSLKIDNNSLKNLSLSDDKDSKKSLKNQKGEFEIRNGKLIVRNSINTEQGFLKLDADIGIDESLTGSALYIASKSVKEQLIQQSNYAKYLLNDKGEFELTLYLAGTVSKPEVTINTEPLQKRFIKNASKEVTNKIKEEIKKNPEVQKLQDDAKKLLEKNGIDPSQFGF
ncbi:AsmA family protein [Pigmentibacter sp. JX0631]|uniref:AsmA family protein n=1 Tax=Pigmentibacter sp. JX0631 TaxID=2976982 RepID=UPI0024686145|nr:AsmA family protein [Pigmentibacter sp. JX0631]WGL59064.1 AsmA family protein [Pigmentibacter sp. JX0631]